MHYYTSIILICFFIHRNDALKECGVSIEQMIRIVGGSSSSPGDWPWQIQISGQFRHKTKCGGTIINENWILTAAHCLEDVSTPEFYVIWLGKFDVSKREDGAILRNISKYVVHPDFNIDTMKNDIALLKLSKPIDFEGNHSHITPICLADENFTVDNRFCVATGWGSLYPEGEGSNLLQVVSLPIIEQETCKKLFARYYLIVTSGMICAGRGGIGVCNGDSGGPLQCKKNGKWYQVGITSWGVGCAVPDVPDVFARVSHYLSWINTVIENY
ncbi:chymotrypsin-like elastase family member 2A [Centruroides sculpturatus]|uniref:chymotrypsin-like elastase family member 2A n=1 Tax=Centruroides sculpturatus TaxID=218467 RepID=UPI000C6D0035|nr:chymotrypsin-like elastase family member 2A [Centruroides sculpturatus]